MAVVGTHSFKVVVYHKRIFAIKNQTTIFIINSTVYAVKFIHTHPFHTS